MPTPAGFSRRITTAALLLALMLCATPPGVRAATAADPMTFDQVMSKWTVMADGTWTVEADVTLRAPKGNPTHVVRMPVTWSASTEKLEIVQARIDKPDGRSVILPKEAIRVDPPVGDRWFHEFSDENRMIITFSDVDDGDLLILRTRRDVFHPRVPGGFMAAPVLDKTVAWDDTNYAISVPIDMPFHYETRVFDHQSETIRDRVVHYFHAPRISGSTPEVNVLSGFDRLPRFAVSTFRDWDEFGKAYASVLLPHAKVTPDIKALAEKLTADKTDPKDQATAIYLWVRDHIRYIPVPLEESKPDPHDAARVLAAGYGDTKDHAVLLYALLAARGIAAELVLLNNTDAATIADPPNIRPMNHLIIYLTGLKTYVDSTVALAPFGVLPFSEIGKPAIHLDGTSGLALRDIPMPPSGATLSDMKTAMVLDTNGGITGTTATMARGALGLWLREAARSIGPDNPGAAAILLREHATPGDGTFSFEPPTAGGDDYTINGTFRLNNQSALLHGGFFAMWTGLRLLPRPGDFLGGPMFLADLHRTTPTFCYPGIQSEEISLTLPEGRALGGLPPDLSIDSSLLRYRSHWAADGPRITISREFQSLVPALVCAGQVREEMADALAKIRADLVSPVGIRQDTLPASAAALPTATAKP